MKIMSKKSISNNKTKPFARTRMLFSTILGIDIPDENSGLDSYINKVNIHSSEEDKENAEIAQALKDSLESINASLFSRTSVNTTSKNSSKFSLKAEEANVPSKSSKKNIKDNSKEYEQDLTL